MLGADQVGQPADGAVAADEVLELPRTVQRRGVPVDVVVNVLFVGVGTDEESVICIYDCNLLGMGFLLHKKFRAPGIGCSM